MGARLSDIKGKSRGRSSQVSSAGARHSNQDLSRPRMRPFVTLTATLWGACFTPGIPRNALPQRVAVNERRSNHCRTTRSPDAYVWTQASGRQRCGPCRIACMGSVDGTSNPLGAATFQLRQRLMRKSLGTGSQSLPEVKQAALSRRALAPVCVIQTGASALRLFGK